MPGFDQVLGQARVVDVLQKAVVAGKVHHAYLFEGPVGTGKALMARALAMALNCEASNDGNPCGACDQCLKLQVGTHPDFIVFDMTQKGLTERVRELVGMCAFRPHEARARVVLLDPADNLAGVQEGARAEAANALLKTLEEPPAGTHFVLATAEARRLPVTVLSRCQRLRFAPVSDEAIERWLIDEHGAEPKLATEAAANSGGSPGRALSELDAGEDAARRRALLDTLVSVLQKPSAQAVFDAAAEVGRDRVEADDVCGLLWGLFRDALLVREDLDAGRVSPARADVAASAFARFSSATLFGALALTTEARALLRGNVAPPLVLEHLLFELLPELMMPRRAQGRA